MQRIERLFMSLAEKNLLLVVDAHQSHFKEQRVRIPVKPPVSKESLQSDSSLLLN